MRSRNTIYFHLNAQKEKKQKKEKKKRKKRKEKKEIYFNRLRLKFKKSIQRFLNHYYHIKLLHMRQM